MGILDIGFGTSEVSACLHADGWTNVTAIDTSVVAVTRARSARRHQGRSELQFLQMDACKMDEIPEKSFDAVLDKALLDTLVTGGHAFPRVRDMLGEVYRVLRPGGVYFCVSHSAAATRLPYLAHDSSKPWRIEVARVEKSFLARTDVVPEDEVPDDVGGGFFHIYVCTKPPVPEAEHSLTKAPESGASRSLLAPDPEVTAHARSDDAQGIGAPLDSGSPEMAASSTLMPVADQAEQDEQDEPYDDTEALEPLGEIGDDVGDDFGDAF